MQRDFDLIRDILIEIENGKKFYEIRSDSTSDALGLGGDDLTGMTDEEADKWNHNLGLIQKHGLVELQQSNGGVWLVEGMTWKGHDFLDSVRDPEIWLQTKEGVKQAGSFSFEIVVAIAKGFIKKKVEKHSGIEIDL